MHPLIVGKYNFYLYKFIELIRHFKIVPLLPKYPRDNIELIKVLQNKT